MTDSTRTLHEMVGVDDDASVEHLRYAYERAMSRATRSGNHRHAMALSRAFDELGAGRQSVYDRHWTPAANHPSTVPSTSRSYRGGTASGSARKTRRWLRRRRLPVAILLVPAVIAVAIFTALHLNDSKPPAVPANPVPALTNPVPALTNPAPVLRPTPLPGQTVVPALQVPADAKVGADGRATVLCQPGPGTAGYLVEVAPGATVQCVNGAVPQIVAASR